VLRHTCVAVIPSRNSRSPHRYQRLPHPSLSPRRPLRHRQEWCQEACAPLPAVVQAGPYFPRSPRLFGYGRGRLKHGLTRWTDNWALVQIIKSRVAAATNALGTEFGFRHVYSSKQLRGCRPPREETTDPVRDGSSAVLIRPQLSNIYGVSGRLLKRWQASAFASRLLRFLRSLFFFPMRARISHHLDANYQLNVTRRPALSHCRDALGSFRARNF
jgi:hypothetical protein